MYRLLVLLTLLGASYAFWFSNDYDPDGWVNQDYGHLNDVDGWVRDDDGWVSEDNCDHSRDNEHDWHASHDNRFKTLSSYIINADQYSRNFCKHYSNCEVQVKHGNLDYEVTYTLPKCDDNITVKIKHRVLYMYARSTQDSSNFFDMRILPDMLKTEKATWTYKGDKLTVSIPNDNEVKSRAEREKTCFEINEKVILVPQIKFQYRFGK